MVIEFEKYNPAKHGPIDTTRGGKYAPLLAPARDGGIVIAPELVDATYQGLSKLIDKSTERLVRRALGPQHTYLAAVAKDPK